MVDTLRLKLKNIITDYCNSIGCKNCDLKWEGGCSATDLQDRIMDLEMEEFNKEVDNTKE